MGARDRSLVIEVADLRRRPGSRLDVRTTVASSDVRMGAVGVADGEPIDVAVGIESLSDGLVATGIVRAHWRGECRRCLEPAEGDMVVDVEELSARPRRPKTRRSRSSTIRSTCARWSPRYWCVPCLSRRCAATTAGACVPSAAPTATFSTAGMRTTRPIPVGRPSRASATSSIEARVAPGGANR